jgi:hypothetical protein
MAIQVKEIGQQKVEIGQLLNWHYRLTCDSFPLLKGGNCMEYNLTYNDRMHKMSINVEKQKYQAFKTKVQSCGIYCISTYVNAMIDRELASSTAFAIQEVTALRNKTFRIASAERRAQEKFNSSRKESFIKLGIKKISNIFNPRQEIFDFK